MPLSPAGAVLQDGHNAAPIGLPPHEVNDVMKISFSKPEVPEGAAVVVGVYDDRKLTPTAAQLDKQTKGAIGRALAASRFKGRADDLLNVLAPAVSDARPPA